MTEDHVRAQSARRTQSPRVKANAAASQRRAAQAEAERRAAEVKARRLKAERLAAAEARKAQEAHRQAKRAEARQAHDRARAAARLEQAKAQRPVRAKPAPDAGALHVADAGRRCAKPDPEAALACADPALASAERQLNRAYREAEAAGVPPERLERQQQRWLAARAAAARQAPWAVHDIYLARIAELQDQTRQAAEGY
jgi:hypothetical protein